ncbi:hypothetical protein ALC57_17349 [Trachymyrmex cornetzi]|uniref:Uncharacterized protein n=1 Tax=Trachymyrmex cornetzi TaxID=471704 RepID=A0A195DD35_9HYME|nr:hypothetical protein ALC57_17349 [Trachymyrmex cornetzi]
MMTYVEPSMQLMRVARVNFQRIEFRRDVECVGDASVVHQRGKRGGSGQEEGKWLHHGCRGADHLTGSALDYGVTQSPPYPSRLVMTVISADDEGDDNNDDGDGANGNNARTQPIASNRNELRPKNELIVDWRIYYRSVALATIKSTIYDTT